MWPCEADEVETKLGPSGPSNITVKVSLQVLLNAITTYRKKVCKKSQNFLTWWRSLHAHADLRFSCCGDAVSPETPTVCCQIVENHHCALSESAFWKIFQTKGDMYIYIYRNACDEGMLTCLWSGMTHCSDTIMHSRRRWVSSGVQKWRGAHKKSKKIIVRWVGRQVVDWTGIGGSSRVLDGFFRFCVDFRRNLVPNWFQIARS